MAARVIELLHGYEENSGFLETPPASAGARIGNYKLLEHIGVKEPGRLGWWLLAAGLVAVAVVGAWLLKNP